MSTATVPSPVTYTQIADGVIRDSQGHALVVGTTTHVLVSKLMAAARAYARCSGSVGTTQVETVLGVEVSAEWLRNEPEPEPDTEFSLDAVVERLHRLGVPAYVEQTGGGCATIYAGGQHVALEGGEGEARWDVAAGPGTYGWGSRPSTACLAEFYVGPNDDGATDPYGLPDTITKAEVAIEWAANVIARVASDVSVRSFAEWNRRPCRYCHESVVPAAAGSWIDRSGGDGCGESPDHRHGVYGA